MCITLNKFKTNGKVNVPDKDTFDRYFKIFSDREKKGHCIFCNKPRSVCQPERKPFVMPSIEELRKMFKMSMEQQTIAESAFLQTMEQSIYRLMNDYPFVGNTLQLLQIQPSYQVPTMGICFNTNKRQFELYINPMFLHSLKSDHRIGVLLHEIYHKTFGHLVRMGGYNIENPEEKKKLNIAMDLVVNQFIDEKLLPISDDEHNNEDKKKKQGGGKGKQEESEGQGQGDENNDGKGNGDGSCPGGECEGKCEGEGYYYEHFWNNNGAGEKELMEATEDLVRRAMVKISNDYSKVPGQVKDLLDYIDKSVKQLNYKAILLGALKKSLPANYRTSTWARKSKRYGFAAPGTRIGDQPKLHMFVDTSGSISVEEVNEFLGIISEFLKVGAPKCKLSFFNTETYGTRTFKRHDKIDKGEIQSGGTDLTTTLKMIADVQPNLSVFLTDGYYSDVDVSQFVGSGAFPNVIFLISNGGDVNHPFSKYSWQKTIKIPK